MMSDRDEMPGGDPADVVVLATPTEDGEGVHGLRFRHRRVELAEIRPVPQGQPLGSGELVSLHPRENPAVCDVKPAPTIDPEKLQSRRAAGPPRVSSSDYRRNYDRVFRKRTRRTLSS